MFLGGRGMEPLAIPWSPRSFGLTPHPALYNLLEIDFPSFWLLLGALRSVLEPLESILAARKWLFIDF